MLVDIHTHLGDTFDAKASGVWKREHRIPDWVTEPFLSAMDKVDKVVLLGFPSPPGNISENECVRHFVAEHGEKFVPFYYIDPKLPTALSDLDRVVHEWGAKGIKLGPIYQSFKPDDEQYFPLYARIEDMGLPIMWHQGSSFAAPDGPLEWARPWMLDKVSRTFPDLKMVIAHFGYPWIRELIALLRKRKNLYTDVSCLANRTWVLYNAFVEAIQYGVEDRIFFGSDFPLFTPGQIVDAMRTIPLMTEGTRLPAVHTDVVERVISRNCLEVLGIK